MIKLLSVCLFLLFPLCAVAQDTDFIGSGTCIGCHEDAGAAWAGSHHAAAWSNATPDNIRADFDGTSFGLGDMQANFRIAADGTHLARVTETDGSVTEYPVHSVVGIEPLQQYLFETASGRLQSFDVVWDTEAGRWFHLYPQQNPPPSDAMHWSGSYKTWNGRCAVCHATGYEANYNPETRSYASVQAEIGVGCESCHGPGAAHLAWSHAQDTPPPPAYGLVDIADPARFLDTCGGCHSRREAFSDASPPAGTPYHDAWNLSLLRPGLYWPDGQIRDEVYVTGSFLQSKMHTVGVTCANCHDPHSGQRIAEGNALCSQCHSPAGNPEFPTLPLEVFDGPEHHRHADGSPGAQCTACHMPQTVYMGNDARADHSFRVPRPDLVAETGAPDACTRCHEDRTADWAASALEEWFPDSAHRGPHYGQILARAFDDPGVAAGDLSILAQSQEPGIVRATALWLLGQGGGPAQADAAQALLGDPDPLVRAAAIDAQRSADPQTRVQRIVGLLGDPLRNVRIAAARALLGAPVAHLPGRLATDLRQAQSEWRATMSARLDFPETHIQLAGLALTLRNFPAAAQAFAEVTELDPQHVDAWVMRVRLAAVLDGPEAARSLLEQAVSANPGDLGLATLLSELGGPAPDLLPPR